MEKRLESSPYRNRFDLTDWGMSFAYIRNSKDPKWILVVPPNVILEGSE